MLLGITRDVIGALGVVRLSVGGESAGESTADVGVDEVHQLSTIAVAALLRDVFDAGAGVLEEAIPR